MSASDRGLDGTDDGHGAYVADMTIHARLSGPGGSDGYHVHVIEASDGQGRPRQLDRDNLTLTRRP